MTVVQEKILIPVRQSLSFPLNKKNVMFTDDVKSRLYTSNFV